MALDEIYSRGFTENDSRYYVLSLLRTLATFALDKADVLNFSYYNIFYINSSLPFSSSWVNLYKHTSKDFRNVYFRIYFLEQDCFSTLLWHFPRFLLRTFAITDSKLRPEDVCDNKIWLYMVPKRCDK